MESNNQISLITRNFKILKRLLTPLSSLKIIKRKMSMKKMKIGLGIMIVSLCFIILITYQCNHSSLTRNHLKSENIQLKQLLTTAKRNFDTPMRHIPLNELYKSNSDHGQDFSIEFEENKYRQANMIDTPGCRIPVAMVNYKTGKPKVKKKESCGERAIYLQRTEDKKIRAFIKENKIKKYLKRSMDYSCCYRFFQRSKKLGFSHILKFTECKPIKHAEEFILENDFINIKCFEKINNKSNIFYDDVFAFCRKINISKNIRNETNHSKKYNVLIVGMDSMSLPRFVQTMTRTVTYLKNNYWPGFRGYHKVGDNTFPNLMAALMGQNLSTIVNKCWGKMDHCNDLLIWNAFKKIGYVTAYGEDYLELPDMFSKAYAFRNAPTDHYMRTFFLKGEREIHNKSLLCIGKATSGQQLLDYALDFVLTYRDDPFFGFFWMNSFSHNINNHPQGADEIFENFFNRLSYTGALDNTFVIFLSDHGIRFGPHRLEVESYYDDRMPFLFLWVPRIFKMNHPEKVKSILINQFRLITPYDLFNTMLEINDLSRNIVTRQPKFSLSHQSIFSTVSGNRTCQDVGIHDKWCSCHKLYPLDVEDKEGVKSVQLVTSFINETINSIKTKPCWSCVTLTFNNISRIHFYYDKTRINQYYLVAFSMTPGNVFYEATVLRRDTKRDLVGSVNIISPYRGFGKCTIKRKDRIFCVCQKQTNCRIRTTL